MSIKNSITLLVSTLLGFALLAVVLGLVSMKVNNDNLHELYDDRVVPLQGLKEIADSYAVNIVDTNHKLRNGNISWQEAEQNIAQAKRDIRQLWGDYMATTLTPEEAQLAQRAQSLMEPADRAVDELERLVKARDMQGITQFSIDRLYPVIDPISDAVTDLVNLQLRVAAELNERNEATYQLTFKLAIMASLIFFALAIFFSRTTLRAVTLPLNELVRVSRHVQEQGDFSARIKVSRQDEVGQAANAFNDLLANAAKAITEANHVVGAIAQSDFSQRVQGQYVGDLDKLKQGVNASAEQVAFMMDELGKVMQALYNGRFDAKMDERVPQAFSQQVDNALHSIDQVIVDINSVMAYMNEGKFQHRVKADARGQLSELKGNINGSMDSLENAVNAITDVVVAQSNGDLTKRIEGEYHGELRILTEAVNNTAVKLTGVVSQAINASNIVHTAADEVSKGALDLSERVQEQAAALEETSATMEEMNSAVQNNTQNAMEATQVVVGVADKASKGKVVMQQTIDAMGAIQESSHKISDIVNLIDGIAFQTNLLALNAAVEAARAGDHGRGFAVVAGEVRALAQKSAQAAKEISTLISESVSRVDQGTKLAFESGDMLNQMNDAVQEVTKMIEQIAQASKEQADGVQQVHQAISNIDQVTQQNAALVEQTSAASESMSEQAAILSNDMVFFNTGNHRQAAPAKLAAPKSASAPKALPIKPKPAADEWSEF
ncbi:hypothetical protein THIAE_02750 [Thiomicrospira aerophila AL3]|uniref:Methyl-accepting chemotaxis protein n=1 Tax=Thiomicrospira aerophila AL3 TaxID=717772 RepID=W0DZ03_9GAMM|nr:methyl-accepting chemotaxis protein [Thiomicrospira aerophila]AHF02199.1 hypothetical protein THIAE_02750 [Thiomicrospira aerophila AL3]